MGGFAAKQRRRVERQSLQRPQNEFDDSNDDMPHRKKHSLKSRGDSPLHRRSQQPLRPNTKNMLSQRGKDTKAAAAPMKKKAINKPKHLKRKIESISGDTTESITMNSKEKERLLQQLEEFERRKQQLGHNLQNSSKIIPTVIKNRSIDKTVAMYPTTTKSNRNTMTDDKRSNGTFSTTVSHVKPKHEHVKMISKTSTTSVTGNVNAKDAKRESPAIASETTAALKTQSSIVRKDDISVKSKNDDDGDDDDEIVTTNPNTRQRGKRLRRRGAATVPSQESTDVNIDDVVVSVDSIVDESSTSNSIAATDSNVAEGQKQRRCIGRKPVTDFTVGQYYSGTIVYTKPFGIFVDIGCHSDAFCHVSQLSTVFVDNPIDTYPVGTNLDEIRVVEIDRKKKRITVSLKKETETNKQEEIKDKNHTRSNANSDGATTLKDDANPSVHVSKNKNGTNSLVIAEDEVASKEVINHEKGTTQKIVSTSDQLKRERKLARRAERRNNQND